MATWCHDCLLSLGHYGSHERDLGAYTQEVAKFSMKRCCIVGTRIYDSCEGVGNFFNMPMWRLECGWNFVPWLFVEPWILWIHKRDWLAYTIMKRYSIVCNTTKDPSLSMLHTLVPLQFVWGSTRYKRMLFLKTKREHSKHEICLFADLFQIWIHTCGILTSRTIIHQWYSFQCPSNLFEGPLGVRGHHF